MKKLRLPLWETAFLFDTRSNGLRELLRVQEHIKGDPWCGVQIITFVAGILGEASVWQDSQGFSGLQGRCRDVKA
jgi:hypothetical protein